MLRKFLFAVLFIGTIAPAIADEVCPRGYGYQPPIELIKNNLNTGNTTIGGIATNGSHIQSENYRTNNFTEIPVETGKSYSFTTNDGAVYKYLATYDSNHNFIERVNIADVYHCPDGVSYIIPVLYVQNTNHWTLTADYTTVLFTEFPLHKVGDYEDTIDYDTGTVTREVGVKVFDGTEDIVNLVSASGYIYCDRKNEPQKAYGAMLLSCSHFVGTKKTRNILQNHEMGVSNSVSGSQQFCFRYDEISTIEDFKAYFVEQYANGTPVTVYYPLTMPVVESISDFMQREYVTSVQDGYCSLCPPNTYKDFVGNEACTPCPSGTLSPAGATSVDQCGHILHIGGYNVYMPVGRRTEHGLCTMLDGVKYCADLYERE